MAELNLSQIEEKLNSEFRGEGRRLVFWYDDKGDFADGRMNGYGVYYYDNGDVYDAPEDLLRNICGFLLQIFPLSEAKE